MTLAHAVAATALTVAGVVPGSASAAAHPALTWTPCGKSAQCATLTVPADRHHPHGATTRLNLARLRAADPDGGPPLVVNFGSGNSTSVLLGDPPPSVTALAAHSDVVAFDPPGLGSPRNGTLIPCPRPAPPADELVTARTAGEWRAHATANAAYDRGCRTAAGPAYRSLNSWQIAHDLDAVRAALGTPKLRYFGNSYGTSYGQAYAELFGPRVARMYLEGVADHTRPRPSDWLRTYARTQENQLHHFRDWCAADASCALHGTDAIRVWDRLIARAPLPAPSLGDGTTVPRERLYAGGLYGMNPPYWPRLANAMDQARNGDAGAFVSDLHWPPPEAMGNVQSALLCHDYMPDPPSRAEFARIEPSLKRAAPHLGWAEGRAQLGRCAGIRTEADVAYRPHPLRARTTVPVLIGIGELDQNTANLGAAHVAAQWPGARTLWHGDGHDAYLLGNTCVAGHVARYLTTGAVPPKGTRCPAQLAPGT